MNENYFSRATRSHGRKISAIENATLSALFRIVFTEISALRSRRNERGEYNVYSVQGSTDQLVICKWKTDYSKIEQRSRVIAIRSSDRKVQVARIEWTSAVSEDRSRFDSTEHKNSLMQSMNDGERPKNLRVTQQNYSKIPWKPVSNWKSKFPNCKVTSEINEVSEFLIIPVRGIFDIGN